MNRLLGFLILGCVACGGSTGSGGAVDGGLDGSGGSGFGGSSFGGTGGFGGSPTGGGGAGGSGGSSGCAPLTNNQQLGTYKFALAVTLSPTKPILYRANVVGHVDGDLSWLALSAEPLDAADQSTPIGPAIQLVADPSSNGMLHFPPTLVSVPGAANPITGSDIEANVEMTGQLCGSSPFYCGDATGQVTKPIVLDLAGSTFTIETEASPVIHTNCQMDVADPP